MLFPLQIHFLYILFYYLLNPISISINMKNMGNEFSQSTSVCSVTKSLFICAKVHQELLNEKLFCDLTQKRQEKECFSRCFFGYKSGECSSLTKKEWSVKSTTHKKIMENIYEYTYILVDNEIKNQ